MRLRLELGPYTLEFTLDTATVDTGQGEPPLYVDTKYAASLGNPDGFGLRVRPDHTDAE